MEERTNEGRSPYATRYPDIFGALGLPFGENEVRFREENGRRMAYITARTAMNRLDDVIGPENWSFDVSPFGDSSVCCRMTVVLPDGTTVTKCDLGSMSRMSERSKAADPGDDDKGGASDGLKRVAAMFGVGRYLYGNGVPGFVKDMAHGPDAQSLAPYSASPPPSGRSDPGRRSYPPRSDARDSQPEPRAPSPDPRGNGSPPRSGKALFAWTMAKKTETGVDLLAHINGWAKDRGWTGRMVEWDADLVRSAYEEAVLYLDGRSESAAAH